MAKTMANSWEGGKEEGKTKMSNHKKQLRLREEWQSPPQPQDHSHPSLLPSSQQCDVSRGLFPPPRGGCGKMFFACRGFPPFQAELLLAAAAASCFHSQAALGVTAELCAPLPLPRGRVHSWGAAGALPSSLSFAQDVGLGKTPGLAPAMLSGSTPELRSCLVEAYSAETPAKRQMLMLDNGPQSLCDQRGTAANCGRANTRRHCRLAAEVISLPLVARDQVPVSPQAIKNHKLITRPQEQLPALQPDIHWQRLCSLSHNSTSMASTPMARAPARYT